MYSTYSVTSQSMQNTQKSYPGCPFPIANRQLSPARKKMKKSPGSIPNNQNTVRRQDLNNTTNSHQTSFEISVSHGKLDSVKNLIDKGVDVNRIGNNRKRPLSEALSKGHTEIAKLLLSKNAYLNEIDADGFTPLANAVYTANSAMVQHLISLGADPCNRGNNGKTPLQIAVQKSNVEMVKVLVNNGADPTIPCAFLEAITTKNVEIFKYLLEKGPPINGIYKNGDTPLIKAMEAGNFEIIQCLVKTGAQMPHSERIKQFLLKYIEKSNLEMVKCIVEAGVNVNTIYENGDTPIMKALECPNSVLIIKYLMEKGAKFPSVDKINQSGMLIRAVESKNHLIVKLLVDNGADVDQTDSNGRLPLIVAAMNRAFSVIKILIEAGANVDLAKNELDNFANCNDDFAFYLQNQRNIMKRTKNIILF